MVVSKLLNRCFINGGDNGDDNNGGDDDNNGGDDTTGPQMVVYSIQTPVWLTNAGISRALFHDRQALGIVLSAGGSISIAQDATMAVGDLHLDLLGNDTATDSTDLIIPATGEAVTVTASTDSCVPFIQTPFDIDETGVNFTVTAGTAVELPVYVSGSGNEAAFFELWDANSSPYALLEGDSCRVLVPLGDRDALRAMTGFESLYGLMNYYDWSVIGSYDDQIGLAVAPANSTDLKPSNKFFIRADISGTEGAYYTDYWVGFTGASIAPLLTYNSWTALHTIALGYNPSYVEAGMDAAAATAALLAVQVEYHTLGDNAADAQGWLWDGNKSTVEAAIFDALEAGETFDTMVDVRYSTVMLVVLRQKAGMRAWKHMNQQYRAIFSTDASLTPASFPYADLMLRYLGEASSFDFVPVLERWGVPYSATQGEANRTNGYAPAAHLIDTAVAFQQLPFISTFFIIVTTDELASLGVIGGLAVTFQADDVTSLEGQTLTLNNGPTEVAAATIASGAATFADIPIGVYTFGFPDTSALGIPEENYAIIRGTGSASLITFTTA
ncbi:hypothetical protein TRICI_002001 [Trichomonascus ciferrii]|uniref:Peptidase M60 domain-containing protein n=1 Tax=Trichomonascus ciferrii TaxID=44093 RepID=A0A642V8D8_9ASCO|nr:hypothetical protein TRICI_002001 [Trichomonascus ciferrii]